MVAQINSAGIGIRASYDSNLERLFLMTTGTGEQAEIHVKADAQNFLTDYLKLDVMVGEDESNAHRGTDAVIDFNDAVGLKFSGNQFTVNGITVNLKEAGGQTVRVAVSHDVDAVVEKIKAFVETYNSTLESITGELYEQRYRDYPPLTDEQKKEMSDREIELWEEKARSGMLRGDQLLSSIYNNIRSVTMARVEGLSGPYNNLSSIGLLPTLYREGEPISTKPSCEALTRDRKGE